MVVAQPALRRIPPVAVARAFCAMLRQSCPIDQREPVCRSFRDAVDDHLQAEFGVPLPAALDWLVAAACRRAVPAEQLTGFLADLFDLQPLNGRTATSR